MTDKLKNDLLKSNIRCINEYDVKADKVTFVEKVLP